MSSAAGLTMPAIAQGARSVARVVVIAGSACVEKRFNAYRDPPSIKLTRELAFYRAYPDVPVMPTLVSHRAPDTITLRYVEGERLIDLIESKAVDADDITEVSEHYGTASASSLPIARLQTRPRAATPSRTPCGESVPR